MYSNSSAMHFNIYLVLDLKELQILLKRKMRQHPITQNIFDTSRILCFPTKIKYAVLWLQELVFCDEKFT